MAQKILIIGGVACGPKAAARARRRDAEAEITIVERGAYPSFASCGLPYYVGGVVPGMDPLVSTGFGVKRDVDYFREVKDIVVRTRTEALSVDREARTVLVRDLDGGTEERLPYDQLVLATGARPKKIPIPGLELDHVWNLWTLPDAETIRERIEEGEADRIVIIGAGLIGLEAAEALVNQAVETTLIDVMPQVLYGPLDPEMAELVAEALRAEKVELFLGERVERLEGSDGRVCRVITDKREIDTDAVILAIGAEPNVELAASCGLELGETGAIRVDESLRTSDPRIFAGGDCVENTHLVTGRKAWIPLGSTANIHGRIIGDNLTGGRSVHPGILGTGIMRTLGTNVGFTGICEQRAAQQGYETVTALAPANDKSHFYPGGKNVTIKVVADRKTGRLLGVQVVGPGDVARVVDAAASALRFGATLEDLGCMDFAYAPPFGTPIEPLANTANVARNKLEGLANSIGPLEMRELLASKEDFLIIDVRTAGELETRPRIEDPRLRHMDMARLRRELETLPREKPVIVVCQLGPRGYDVQCTLRNKGFRDVRFMEAGMNVLARLGAPVAGAAAKEG